MPVGQLNLKAARVGRTGASALADVLERDSFLTYINLEDNGLGDDGATAVAQVW